MNQVRGALGAFSRSWGRALAVVVALTAIVGTMAPQQADASPRGITGGYVDWGVKAAFRNYITTIAGGSITPSGGVTVNGNGTFRFPAVAAGSHDPDADGTSAFLLGSVRFVGHGGLLDLTISDVRLEIDGTSGAIVADVVSRDLDTGNFINYPDIELVTLNLTSTPPTDTQASVSWSSIPSVLTASGEPSFEGFYTAGTAFDPVSPNLSLEPVGNLTWKVSQHAWTSSSLTPAHATGAPAVKDSVNGFVFPTHDVTFNPATAVTSINLDGSLTLGNVVQGGYRIMLSQPSIVIDAAGDGTVIADVSYCVSTAACANPWVGPVADVTITTFDFNWDAVTVTGGQYTWTLTPHYASVGNQFDQEFIDTLDASLRGHFLNTGSGSDVNKPPAPITITFDSWICGADADCDGFTDASLTTHADPANTNTAFDNCLGTYNYAQLNNDGNFIDTTPPLTQDDNSIVMSDAAGDACDLDDDNDGVLDTAEASLPGASCPSATGALNPLDPDSDGDGYLDGAECAIGTDPSSPVNRPSAAQCAALAGVGVSVDTDGDRLLDRVEVCGHGSSPIAVDSDGDGRRDGCEAGSLNTLPAVNSGDQLLLAQAVFLDVVGPFTYNADINRDGANNSGDQLLLAGIITQGGGPGPCPSF